MKVAGAAVVAILFLSLVTGCSDTPVTRPVNRAPSPATPQGVVRLFSWCWNERDTTSYREVFTGDFRFVFAIGDSAGNMYRDDPFDRDEMLGCARHLFVGGGAVAPARSITLVLDDILFPLDDSRPGKNPRWHREIPTTVGLTIVTDGGAEYNVQGNATFYVVRGDSAVIPADLGFAPDSTRWYIERWEDYTLSAASTAAVVSPLPARSTTWGQILTLYR